MSTIAPDRAPSAAPATSDAVTWIVRQWRRPFRRHVAAVALVLLALMPLLGTNRLFHVDEGATLAQTELLARGDGWKYEQPRADLDPTDRWSPFWPSDGEGSAPLDKHPTYSLLLVGPVWALGATGAVLMSVLGAWAAAVVAALIARRLGPELDRPVLWVTALVSPVFLYGYVAVAHTLGAAAAGAAALAALRTLERPGPRATVAVVALVLAAILLRSEGVLFGVALAVALGVVSVKDRRGDVAVVAVAALAATAGGYLLDPWLTTRLVSDADPFVVDGITNSSAPFLIDRLTPTGITLVLPGYGAFGGLGGMLSTITAVAATAAAWVIRRRPEDHEGIRLFVSVAAATAVLRLLLAPAVVPGLLIALPFVVPGLLLVRRPLATRSPVVLLAVGYALYVAAVLATQYRLGGTGEWGFRYAILGLPLLVPLVVAGLRSGREVLDPLTRRIATVAFVVVCLATTVLAAGSLRSPQAGSAELVQQVAEARTQVDRPVVVTNDNTVPRFAWDQILDGQSWLRVPEAEMPEAIEALAADGAGVVLVSSLVDEQLPLFESTYRVVSRSDAQLSADREIVALEPI